MATSQLVFEFLTNRMHRIKEASKKCFDKVKDSDWKGNVGLALQGTAAVIDLGFVDTS